MYRVVSEDSGMVVFLLFRKCISAFALSCLYDMAPRSKDIQSFLSNPKIKKKKKKKKMFFCGIFFLDHNSFTFSPFFFNLKKKKKKKMGSQ